MKEKPLMRSEYSISELAREFSITPRAIRFYEEKGLLTPQRNGSSRIFNAADRVRLVLILRGKRIGFSLEESRDIIDMYKPETANTHQLESLLNKLHEKRLLLERQKKEINMMISDLKKTENTCRKALKTSENK
jgi:DNA-binding transcriptional MerR regulator